MSRRFPAKVINPSCPKGFGCGVRSDLLCELQNLASLRLGLSCMVKPCYIPATVQSLPLKGILNFSKPTDPTYEYKCRHAKQLDCRIVP
jgi:hypothetical protein